MFFTFLRPIVGWLMKHRFRAAIVLFWGGCLLVLRWTMDANALTFGDLTAQLQVLLGERWYGALLYIVIYLVRPLTFFPGTLLTILGGSVFGVGWGFALSLVAGTLSAIVPYGVGRWFSPAHPETVDTPARLGRFVVMLRSNPFQAVLVMRLIYLPYDAVNLFAGTLRIPFHTFIAATLVGNLASTLSFVSLGASVEGDLAEGGIHLDTTMLLFSAVIIVASLLLSRLLNRFQRKEEVQVP